MENGNIVYVSLGSNLGDRTEHVEAALDELENLGEILKTSSFQETDAWGKTDQPYFLNVVLKMTTELEPLEFLKQIQLIETKLGRVRTEKWGPRTIDIDILLWNKEVINHPNLKVPHPHLQEREFMMEMLREVLS